MKLLFSDLPKYTIQKLVINSIDQAIYQAIVVIDNHEHVVWENSENVLRARSVMALRESFEPLGIDNIVLRHESAYDEMVGQPPKTANNRLEVPLGKTLYPELKL
ncbi:DUF6482 family protein [Alteromonas sp. a30]|uniref:DUF6482 family protein n=1 Tax=Alteromonas sp. a30 TaxID=2730917 RepID=UPI0022821582|nr:DUF6482 family protein [Alteromonas sp. a30]MCY7295893.1 hypothetical protein [Alteromonas sp. a30]